MPIRWLEKVSDDREEDESCLSRLIQGYDDDCEINRAYPLVRKVGNDRDEDESCLSRLIQGYDDDCEINRACP